jgi:hypothetical protein
MRAELRFVVLAVVGACTFAEPPDVTDAFTIKVETGDGQSGTSGDLLAAPLIAKVVDTRNQPVENFSVDFAATEGGGQVSAQSVRTDSLGHAQIMFTLGPTNGTNTVVASGLDTGSTATFTATGYSGPVAKLVATSGDNQSALVTTPLAMPVVVTALDAHDNPVEGIAVTFAVTSGGATVDTPGATTDASGQAQTTITIGAQVGKCVIQASTNGAAPVTFDVYGTNGVPTQIVRVSGNAQTALAGTTAPLPLVVAVKDAQGNPVEGVPVSFVVTAGVGTAGPTVASDASGLAQSPWTFGTSLLPASIEARSGALPSATFTERPRSFGAKTDFTISPSTVLAVGDLNADGKQDVVAAGSQLSVFINTTAAGATTPTLGTPTVVSPAGTVYKVVVADLTTDGKPDLVVLSAGAQYYLAIFPNTTGAGLSSATFGTAIMLPVAPKDFAIGDMNGDSRLDIVVPEQGNSAEITTFVNSTTNPATPMFAPSRTTLASGAPPQTIAVKDMNGDAKPDVVFVADPVIAIGTMLNGTAKNATSITLAAPAWFTPATIPSEILPLDINEDGAGDLVFAAAGTVSIALHTGSTVSFASQVDFTDRGTPFVLADIDENGKPDIVGATSTSVAVSLNTTASMGTTPSFAAPATFTTSVASAVAVADLNDDTHLDLVVTSGGNLSLFLSQ